MNSMIGPAKVLIIDDEEVVRQSLADYLEDRGCQLFTAENGHIGLEVIERERPDLVLTDLRMPEVDGLEVIRRSMQLAPDTPIIVVSGAGRIADSIQALRLGAWDYVLKPVEDMAVLEHRVERALEKARLTRENQMYQQNLERLVSERTAELEQANSRLRASEERYRTLFKDLQASNNDLLLAYDATIEGWARALELRDVETEGHSRRVVTLTLEMARRIGIEESGLTDLYRGALLHDIGKLGIPDSILQKPGPLSNSEWQIMRQHPVYAFEWLSQIEYLRPALHIPHYHHEKWDGTGYPCGLRTSQIPLATRVFTVVDVWDALRSDRPYRQAWSDEEAHAYIEKQAGIQFDPRAVETLFEIIDD